MNKNSSKLLFLLAPLLVFTFVGCGAPKFLGFGMAKVELYPSEFMNPDDNGSPLPTKVRIYQLKSKYEIEQADFKAIWRNDKGVLAGAMLEKREIVVYPRENQKIKIEKKDDAQYIAIVAIFRKPDEETGGWKQIFELKSWTMGSQDIDVIIGENKLEVGVLEDKE